MYGCVEAAALWYANLSEKLRDQGFVENPYDPCVFNKTGKDGNQVTVVIHVDDLFTTSVSQANLDELNAALRRVYPEVTTRRGRVLDYVGMTFDFRETDEVKVTMAGCVDEILAGSGVQTRYATPATSTLFEVREDAEKATQVEAERFHTYTAKLLYLSKRVRPEMLVAVSFLTTRVQKCDKDDLAKLQRALGYLLGSKERGIVLRIGEHISVSAFIDAAYGVHPSSGKSHTGSMIMIGDAALVYTKSGKQGIVVKSSTEAELVGVSDSASQAIHMRNFVLAQGYDVGPVMIYQDNLSCMALLRRGSPASGRSRHINIRHFWLKDREVNGEVAYEHLGTAKMSANVLTKPVQGQQFRKERMGLTNWAEW
jgi:hypothetical protein